MNVREVANSYGLQNVLKKRSTDRSTKAEKNVDKIELSAEAKELQKAQYEQKIGQIRERINNGFYSQKMVLERVAIKLINDLEQ